MTNSNSNILTSVLDELFNTSLSDIVGAELTRTKPSVNIIDDAEGYALEVAAPGLTKKDFNVNVEDDKLIISADVKTDDGGQFTKKEYDYESFSRSFRLSKDVDRDTIKASYDAGILTVSMKKKGADELNTKINIAVG